MKRILLAVRLRIVCKHGCCRGGFWHKICSAATIGSALGLLVPAERQSLEGGDYGGDLEALQRVGIGGVLYMEVDQGAPKGRRISPGRCGENCSSTPARRRTAWAWKST